MPLATRHLSILAFLMSLAALGFAFAGFTTSSVDHTSSLLASPRHALQRAVPSVQAADEDEDEVINHYLRASK